tara:strand:+ start:700 stop:1131 length:432 start_codon:yes stop_codon:yes gene_type:complete
MKLTTERLKKLIREELSKISEAADDLSQMGSDTGFDYEPPLERAKGFMGDSMEEQPLSIEKNGDANFMFSVDGDPDYDFVPKVLNMDKLKNKPTLGMAQTVGSITLTLAKQQFKIHKDGKFAVKSKDGQTVLMQIPRDQMQEL